ncbi:MAG: HIT domain-containing protein [bacterium]|nr:HIT domain-containing protein [bacterium]MDZ4296573.1 HIT domain-containing protein [Patescibacteria group bacterium]
MCIFCDIIQKEIPAEVVYENAAALAFLDVYPRSPGHTLVVPKAHAPTILELEDAAMAPFSQAVKTVTAMVALALKPDGFTIGINHGTVSGQEVAQTTAGIPSRAWYGHRASRT